jgi:hypothetical protein
MLPEPPEIPPDPPESPLEPAETPPEPPAPELVEPVVAVPPPPGLASLPPVRYGAPSAPSRVSSGRYRLAAVVPTTPTPEATEVPKSPVYGAGDPSVKLSLSPVSSAVSAVPIVLESSESPAEVYGAPVPDALSGAPGLADVPPVDVVLVAEVEDGPEEKDPEENDPIEDGVPLAPVVAVPPGDGWPTPEGF